MTKSRRKVTEKSDVESFVELDHPDLETGLALLTEAFGTHNMAFTGGLIGQIASTASKGQELNEKDLNFMLSLVKGVEPRDQIEAMLAAQMAAPHNATITYAKRLNNSDTFMESEAAERTFNKLARTFTTQMTALKNYRTVGQQKMTVEHVHVHEGGQAIVGNVRGWGCCKKSGTNLMKRTYAFQTAPRCTATSKRTRHALPGTCPSVAGPSAASTARVVTHPGLARV